jgi:hypothetical protein
VSRELIEGALATLKRVELSEIDTLHQQFQDSGLYLDAGFYDPPGQETLENFLEGDELQLWHLTSEEGAESVGYMGIVTFSGPTYVFVHFFDVKRVDLDLAQDAMLLIVKDFFKTTDEQELWTYVDKPISDEIHDRLIEGGFDFLDCDIPGIDRAKVGSYIMERHTFDAYYGEEAEDEELDDY